MDIHAGIWLALRDAGIDATTCSGTSAGAIVSAMDAAGKTADEAAKILKKLSDDDVRSERFLWKIRLPWIDWFLAKKPVMKVLAQTIPADLAGLRKPLMVWSADELNGGRVRTEFPKLRYLLPLLESVYASMAIPGVFPPVEKCGLKLSDGGTVNYCAVPDEWQSYDEVWVLIAAPPYDFVPRKPSVISRLLQTTSLLMDDQIWRALADVKVGLGRRPAAGSHAKVGSTTVRVIRTNVGTESSMLRFDHDLIEAARKDAAKQIELF